MNSFRHLRHFRRTFGGSGFVDTGDLRRVGSPSRWTFPRTVVSGRFSSFAISATVTRLFHMVTSFFLSSALQSIMPHRQLSKGIRRFCRSVGLAYLETISFPKIKDMVADLQSALQDFRPVGRDPCSVIVCHVFEALDFDIPHQQKLGDFLCCGPWFFFLWPFWLAVTVV